MSGALLFFYKSYVVIAAAADDDGAWLCPVRSRIAHTHPNSRLHAQASNEQNKNKK